MFSCFHFYIYFIPKIVFIIKFTILGFALNLAITKQAKHSHYRTNKEEGFKDVIPTEKRELFNPSILVANWVAQNLVFSVGLKLFLYPLNIILWFFIDRLERIASPTQIYTLFYYLKLHPSQLPIPPQLSLPFNSFKPNTYHYYFCCFYNFFLSDFFKMSSSQLIVYTKM